MARKVKLSKEERLAIKELRDSKKRQMKEEKKQKLGTEAVNKMRVAALRKMRKAYEADVSKGVLWHPCCIGASDPAGQVSNLLNKKRKNLDWLNSLNNALQSEIETMLEMQRLMQDTLHKNGDGSITIGSRKPRSSKSVVSKSMVMQAYDLSQRNPPEQAAD